MRAVGPRRSGERAPAPDGVHQLTNPPQRMVTRDALLGGHVTEQ